MSCNIYGPVQCGFTYIYINYILYYIIYIYLRSVYIYIIYIYILFFINGVPPNGWCIKMQNHIKTDDLGVPASIYGNFLSHLTFGMVLIDYWGYWHQQLLVGCPKLWAPTSGNPYIV